MTETHLWIVLGASVAVVVIALLYLVIRGNR